MVGRIKYIFFLQSRCSKHVDSWSEKKINICVARQDWTHSNVSVTTATGCYYNTRIMQLYVYTSSTIVSLYIAESLVAVAKGVSKYTSL